MASDKKNIPSNSFKESPKTENKPKHSGRKASAPSMDFSGLKFTVRHRKILGTILLFFSIYLSIASISHLFSGISDQTLSELGPIPTADETASNITGTVGAWFSNLLISRAFGWIGILLPFYGIALSFSVLHNKRWELMAVWFVHLFFFLYFFSLTLAWFSQVWGIHTMEAGGGLGHSMVDWLSVYIGKFGVAIIILLVAGFYFTTQTNFNTQQPFIHNLVSLFRSWSQPLKPVFANNSNNHAQNQVYNNPDNPQTDNARDAEKENPEENADDAFILGYKKGGKEVENSGKNTDEKLEKDPEILQNIENDPVQSPVNQSNGNHGKIEPVLELKEDELEPFHVVFPNRKKGDVEFVIEEKPEEQEVTALNPDDVFQNLTQIEEDTFAKIILDEDKEALDEEDIVADWDFYDPTRELSHYKYPSIDLLKAYDTQNSTEMSRQELEENKDRIVKTLRDYNIEIVSIKATVGPTVTLYEIIPAPGVRISKIKGLEDDIALSLAALGIRIIAPMPGKGTIGIEIPNSKPEIVSYRSVIATEKFRDCKHELPVALGKTISNEVFIADLAKMPHLLVAGATGQGKSVGLNGIIASILFKKHPSQVKFVLIDPKKVEMSLYQLLENHFLAKLPSMEDSIITDTKQVVHVLNSLCKEMDDRYELLKTARVRNITEYNAKFMARRLNPKKGHRFLPYIVLVIDELADLMMTAGKEVETPIARLAQLARAIGIHLVVATQRPSVNVITGIIKANFPARMSYRVISKIDSRTILDTSGADQLIGRGDMLFSTGTDLIRIQNAFVDTPEIEQLVNFISDQQGYNEAYMLPEIPLEVNGKEEEDSDHNNGEKDFMFDEAARLIVKHQHGSTSLIQRRLKLGFNRAGRIMDQLERAGIVGPQNGSKPREVFFKSEEELERFLLKI